jgi:hypothetical protein
MKSSSLDGSIIEFESPGTISRILTAAATALTISVTAGSAHAQTSVTWSGPSNYGVGSYPSVALSGTSAFGIPEVEVHEGTDVPALWAIGGVLGDLSTNAQDDYTQGYFPNIGGDIYGNFVEVHSSTSAEFGTLWYFLGHDYINSNGSELVPSFSTWDSYANGGGMPSVAAWSGTPPFPENYLFCIAIEAHNGTDGSSDSALWSQIGFPQGPCDNWTSINWGSATNYDNGYDPSIAIGVPDGNGNVQVLEVHNGGTGEMWFHTGELNIPNGYITWFPSAYSYGTGNNPSVAICPDGAIIEVHEGANGVLESFTGYYSSTSFNAAGDPVMVFPQSTTPVEYAPGPGFNPKVACDPGGSGNGLEVHNGQQGGGGKMWTRSFTESVNQN